MHRYHSFLHAVKKLDREGMVLVRDSVSSWCMGVVCIPGLVVLDLRVWSALNGDGGEVVDMV